MTTREFRILPRGTIFRIPGEQRVYIKSEVYYEGMLQELPYDGKHTIILPEDIPDSVKVEYNPFLYRPRPTSISAFQEAIRKNRKKLQEIDDLQRKKRQILWRYLELPYKEGIAIYQIVYVTPQKVRLLHVTGMGEDLLFPGLYDGCYFDRALAESNIIQRELTRRILYEKNKK